MRARLARSARPDRTRPKVERKIGHLMRRRHGGRRARVRGLYSAKRPFRSIRSGLSPGHLHSRPLNTSHLGTG